MNSICLLNPFTLFYQNARSIRNKIDQLEAILSFGYHTICLTETWSSNSDDDIDNLFDAYAYKLVENHRIDRRGGGVSVAFKGYLTPALTLLNQDDFVIVLFQNINLLIACIYLSPTDSMERKLLLIQQLIKILYKKLKTIIYYCVETSTLPISNGIIILLSIHSYFNIKNYFSKIFIAI